jgi:thiol:disulfide interchange protein DsbD
MTLSLSEYAPERMEDLRGLLAYSEDPGGSSFRRDYYVSIPVRQAVAAEGAASQSFGGLAAALLFGVLGGLILNLMPCVFPILGLKVMSFVKQAGQSRRAAWAHSLVFTLGVLVSLWALAGMLLAFRAAGHSVGWGFQLQNPGVLFVGIIIFLLFGLNMLGVFEVGMGAAGIGQGVTNKSGLVGAFFSGVLAVVVATPCSAPFLGTAIGYAMVQPAVLLFAVFSAIGLGFALPYLLFAAFPKLLRFLPKPGMWMVRLKQAMSLLLFATVAYLVWVLRAFLDTETQLVSLVIAMILIVLAAVLYGHFSLPHVVRRKRVPGVLAAILLLGMGVYGGWPRVLPASPTDRAETDGVRMFSPAFSASSDKPVFEEWTSGLPESLASGGAVVYADFTARWCATCQVNKALVFGSQEVRDYMREHKVIVLEADWTRQDAAITDELARWGRFAVPFNVVYAPSMDPMELPQVLTPGIVLDALKKAVAARESSYPNASK